MSTNVAPPLGSTYGSIYFGVIISTVFYGVACMQTYENDPLRTKILVAILWALDTIHEALCVVGAYKYIMAGLANPLSFSTDTPEIVVLVALPTQGYLVYRIYLFSGKNIILPLIWCLVSVCYVFVARALYIADGVLRAADISISNSKLSVFQATLALSFSAGLDVLIAIFMSFLLVRQLTASRFASTAHILQRLMVFSVNTGTWTATFALLTAILLHIFPSSWICTVCMIPLCSVYCNTLLANLNARAYVLGAGTTHNVDLDLFLGHASWVSGGTEGDKQGVEAGITFAANQMRIAPLSQLYNLWAVDDEHIFLSIFEHVFQTIPCRVQFVPSPN
ncbi:hypothetical protein L210DRAFT_3500458 [Boletus edulis BED1]|uniref:DUF6534 domain-containing protein n=1 Tax=Boletus edulis BED1 TaxID=1328754 RepID=A0AAD4GL01_BOLED|nr:hypothetical protein L210DRAFT_3500458 [Boletus edulis BED1]